MIRLVILFLLLMNSQGAWSSSARGTTFEAEHPEAAKGLVRINKDGSYQYKVELKEKSQASALKIGMMTAPKISGSTSRTTYENMYGKADVPIVNFDYEWQPFQKFGALGILLGLGFSYDDGYGILNDGQGSKSKEKFTIYMVPLSTFVMYRLEYWRNQFFVPYVLGGGSYFGAIESRNDTKRFMFGGAFAAGGGGGVHINLSRLDQAGAFALSREYGVADMWITIEGRALQGLRSDIDFTTYMLSAGITVDY